LPPCEPVCQVNSLWIGGKLSTLERLSILSHLRHGHEYHLWVYEDTEVPDGVIVEDGNEILPESEIFCYQADEGKGSVSAFSNLFRYKLLKDRGGWWCDTDVVALKPFEFEDDYVFASEVDRNGSSSPTTCVIKAPTDSAVMNYCYREAGSVDRSTLEWGTIGPYLLAESVFLFDLTEHVRPPASFCPTNWFDAKIDPPLHEWVITDRSYAVHLWHEMWRRNGLDKDAEYPGSLYERLKNAVL
jgi:hypothetical protein